MAVCLTVDVEDWYDGMAEAGYVLPAPVGGPTGLETLSELLATTEGRAAGARVTLFVVGKYVDHVRPALKEFAAAGHELASHGPDHKVPPADPGLLEDWLRRGREMVEDVAERPVKGFRSPRFALPPGMALERYREILARAGYSYVSDRHRLAPGRSAVRELPVFRWKRFPIGGGSYQRLVPKQVLPPVLDRNGQPTVLYYHSYDFGVTLPAPSSARSPEVLQQVLARGRIPPVFRYLLARAGSVSCAEVAHAL